MQKLFVLLFNKKNIYCGKSLRGYGNTYFAKKEFCANEIVMHGFGRLIDHQTRHISIQINEKQHFLPIKWAGKYWNHSCEPNCFVRTRLDGFPDLIAMRKIKIGEELTYAYFMTEYTWSPYAHEMMASCLCGTKKCLGKILSFSQLHKTRKLNLKKKNYISFFLKLFT